MEKASSTLPIATPPRSNKKKKENRSNKKVSFEINSFDLSPRRQNLQNRLSLGTKYNARPISTEKAAKGQSFLVDSYPVVSDTGHNNNNSPVNKRQVSSTIEKENQLAPPNRSTTQKNLHSSIITGKENISGSSVNSLREYLRPTISSGPSTSENIDTSQTPTPQSTSSSSKTKETSNGNTTSRRRNQPKEQTKKQTGSAPENPSANPNLIDKEELVDHYLEGSYLPAGLQHKRNNSADFILEGEMHILQAEDESLLISPNSSQLDLQAPIEHEETPKHNGEDKTGSKTLAQLYARRSARRSTMRRNQNASGKRSMPTILSEESSRSQTPQEREEFETLQPTPRLNTRVTIQELIDPPTTATQNRRATAGNASQQPVDATSSNHHVHGHSSVNLGIHDDGSSFTTSSTPYQHRGNGVCLDLSTMFSGQKPQQRKINNYKTPTKRHHAISPPRTSQDTIVRTINRSVGSISAPENLHDSWANKQCDTFSKWLNYTLLPHEDQEHEGPFDISMNIADPFRNSPHRASFRTLILHQQMAKVRASAMGLFGSRDMDNVRSTIKSEIAKGKLAIRADKDMYRNIALRQQITSLLLSYSTPWLRLGLETIFGETILPEYPHQLSPKKEGGVPDRQSGIKSALKDFIRDRVLSDADVLAKYTRNGCRALSGNFEKRYNTELRSLVLYRIMVFIFFVDRAKMGNVLDKFPRLFTKKSSVKSTKSVLEALCRDFLEAQGNITKHLSKVGLKVYYKQDAMDEIDLSVSNLAVDLRDGVRLTRMTEVLTQAKPKSLLSALRLPAVSRLQKLHNVGVALQALRDFNVPITNDIAAHHLVDGHREMVLNLMWAVVAYCCLRLLLDEKKMEDEIQTVLKSKRMSMYFDDGDILPSEELNRTQEVVPDDDKRRILLLRWCQAVCSCFGLQIFDFTNSFADGRAVCVLIHYYHPKVLELKEILPTTHELSLDSSPITEAMLEERRSNERANSHLANIRMGELGGIPKMLPITDTEHVPEEKSMILCLSYMCSRLIESSTEIRACILIQNQYRRYRSLVQIEEKKLNAFIIFLTWRACKDNYYRQQRLKYGAAVKVIENFFASHRDSMARMQIERIMVQKIQAHTRGYLCRLYMTPLLAEHKAAIRIQCMYRNYRSCQVFQSFLIQNQAALDIQRCWRGSHPRQFLKIMIQLVVLIQTVVRGYLVKRSIDAQEDAAICIQRIWRGFWAQLEYQMDLLDIIAVQSLARRRLAISVRKSSLDAVLVLQLAVRSYLSTCTLLRKREERKEFLRLEGAAIICQTAARRYLAVRELRRQRARYQAAKSIQSVWRAYYTSSTYRKSRLATIKLQSAFRRRAAFCRYLSIRKVAVIMQRKWRNYKMRVFHAVKLQCHMRSFIIFLDFSRKRKAVKVLQCAARVSHATRVVRFLREKRDLLVTKTILCQCLIRRNLFVKRFARFKRVCIIFQARWRARRQLSDYQRIKSKAISVQALVRGYLVRYEVETQSISACICQTQFRRYLCRIKFEHVKRASIVIQSKWRGYSMRLSFEIKKASAICLQSLCRGYLVRRTKRDLELGATKIQSSWRGFSSFIAFQLYRCDVITIQNLVRRYLACCEFQTRQLALRRIQKTAQNYVARLHMIRDVKTIQRVYRGHLIRRELCNLQCCATIIQRVYRGYVTKLQYQMDLVDIIISQGAMRGWLARRQLVREKGAVLRLQQSARVWAAKRKLFFLREIRRRSEVDYISAVVIQQMGRGYLARSYVRKERAATLVQKTWRCYTVHVDFMLSILSAITIQSFSRRILCRNAYTRIKVAVISIQSVTRGALQRRENDVKTRQALSIQSYHRMSVLRTLFCSQRKASILIQSFVRGVLARKELTIQAHAATEIQRMWRGYVANVEYFLAVISAIKIQSILRRSLAMKSRDELMYELLRKRGEELFLIKIVTKIQRAFREYLRQREILRATLTIQVAARKFLSGLASRRQLFRVTLAQSIVRGILIRKRRTKQVRISASRIKQASLKAERDPRLRLGARTLAALLTLRKSTRLVEIMAAVCTIEMSTRLSEVCCAAVVEAKAIEILFSLVRTCNRSLPHVELLHAILLTLLNISKYDYLWSKIDTMNAAEVFLDLVQMFRDKENVFSLAVVLLEGCVRYDETIESICKAKENLKRLKGVYALCVRKISYAGGSRPGQAGPGQNARNIMNAKRHDTASNTRLNCPYDLRHGVRTLKSLIVMLEKTSDPSI